MYCDIRLSTALLRFACSQQMTTEAIEFDLREYIDASLQTVAEHAAIKQIEMCYSTPSSHDSKTKLIGDEFVCDVLCQSRTCIDILQRCKQILLNFL
jgi:hypothetical protein